MISSRNLTLEVRISISINCHGEFEPDDGCNAAIRSNSDRPIATVAKSVRISSKLHIISINMYKVYICK